MLTTIHDARREENRMVRKYLGLASLLICFAAGAAASAPSEGLAGKANENQSATPRAKVTKTPPLSDNASASVKGQASGGMSHSSDAEDHPEEEKIKWTDQIIALFTIILAVATFLLWMATQRLARGAEDQARDFKSSLEITKINLRSAIRVSVDRIDPCEVGRIPKVKVTFKNVGLSYILNLDIDTTQLGYAPTDKLKSSFQSALLTPRPERVTIAPNDVYEIDVDAGQNALTDNMFRHLLIGDHAFYLRIVIKYDDIFNDKHGDDSKFYTGGRSGNPTLPLVEYRDRI